MGDGLRQHKVFVDEFGVNVWTARSKGRAPIGARAVRIVEGQRGSNVTICLAISPQFGLVHSSISPQAMTQERFGEFLLELAELMRFTDDNYVVRAYCVIMLGHTTTLPTLAIKAQYVIFQRTPPSSMHAKQPGRV